MTRPATFQHPVFTRRTAIQAGSIGLLGLGMSHLSALRAAKPHGFRDCSHLHFERRISAAGQFRFETGGTAEIRGELPIATRRPVFRFANTCRN